MQQIQGRTLILICVALALVLAGWAWTYQLLSTRHAAAFWGVGGVGQLVGADEATAWRLGEPGENLGIAERLAGRPIIGEQDISAAPGLLHLRHALTQDRNFRWTESPPGKDAAPSWDLAIRLGRGDQALTILFDRDYAYIGQLTAAGEIRYVDSQPMQKTLRKYFAENPWGERTK